MIKRLQKLIAISIVMFCTGIAGAANGFHDNYNVTYHGPLYADPNGITHVGCYGLVNVRVYESDHFIVYSDISGDDTKMKLARMAETEFAANMSRLGVTDSDLGINTSVASTKLHVCSDGVSSGATGNYTGVSMPALDKSPSNVDPMDLLYCYAGYRNTLRHETVHVIHSKLANNDNLSGVSGNSATWFSEGLAVYLSDSSNLSSPGGILLDTGSLASYFADGRPNPVHVNTRADMPGLSNNDIYPAFALAVKYLFDSPARGGAGNSLSSLKGMFQSGTPFATAFANTFSRGGSPLTVNDYATNFQTWMNTYLSAQQTSATVTGATGIKMAGIFKYRCDMIMGIGVPVTAGTFTLNVSELADGPYAFCVMTDPDNGVGLGPGTVTVSGGKLVPASYDVSTWSSPLSTTAIIPINVCAVNSTGTISVMSSDVCGDWQATSPDSWITFPSGSSGSGNGTVTYSIGVNSGASRQGTMTINGETYTVNQAATSGNNPYKIGGSTHGYSTIQDAYNALAEGNTLKIQALEFTGGLLLAQEKTVTLQGGFNCDFTSNLGYTTISDKMTVKHGTVIIERLIIK